MPLKWLLALIYLVASPTDVLAIMGPALQVPARVAMDGDVGEGEGGEEEEDTLVLALNKKFQILELPYNVYH